MSEASGPHVEDLAALYALGSLSEAEAMQVRVHVAQCEECRESVSDAEASVTAMIEADDRYDPPSQLRRRIAASARERSRMRIPQWGAIAAALLLWIVPAAWFYTQTREQAATIDEQSAAVSALVHSHFLHAPFSGLVSGAPAAKVIFSAKGDWFYVVVSAPAGDLLIGTYRGGALQILGKPANVGANSAFYDKAATGIDNVVIVRGGRVVARAAILRRKGE